MRKVNSIVELASGEYDRRKMNNPSSQMPIIPVAKMFGLNPKTLINYRANYISRKTRRHVESQSQ